MRNRKWWAMSVATVMVAAACSSGRRLRRRRRRHNWPRRQRSQPRQRGHRRRRQPPYSRPFRPVTPTWTRRSPPAPMARAATGKKVNIQVQWTGGEGWQLHGLVGDFERRPASRSTSTASARATRPSSGRRIEGDYAPDIASSPSRPRRRLRGRGQGRRHGDVHGRREAEREHPATIGLERTAATSGASHTRSTSSRPSGIRSRRLRPRATPSPRPGTT